MKIDKKILEAHLLELTKKEVTLGEAMERLAKIGITPNIIPNVEAIAYEEFIDFVIFDELNNSYEVVCNLEVKDDEDLGIFGMIDLLDNLCNVDPSFELKLDKYVNRNLKVIDYGINMEMVSDL